MEQSPVRLDKWLWAARFYKTRALAQEAVQGGKVEVNGHRAKPGRALRVGDTVKVRHEWEIRIVEVRALAERRGPAAEARKLYEETAESLELRRKREEQEAKVGGRLRVMDGKPDKRQRREIRRFLRGW